MKRLLLCAGVAAGFFVFAHVIPASAAPLHRPPNCSAIAFRPIVARNRDGDQYAGLYSSRYGRIALRVLVRGGRARNYFVEIDGKRLRPAGKLPRVIAVCARMKRLPPPRARDRACTGDQLQVLTVHDGDRRYILLYAHRAGAWRFCSAGLS